MYIFFLFFLFHFQNKICIVVCLSLTVLIIVIVIVVLIVNQFSSVVEKRWSLHIFCSLAPIAWCVASMFVSFYLNIILFFVCLVIIIHIYSIFWFVLHCEYFWLQKQPYISKTIFLHFLKKKKSVFDYFFKVHSAIVWQNEEIWQFFYYYFEK